MSLVDDLDERAHAAALKARLGDGDAPWPVYDYDEVPGGNRVKGDLPARYLLISVGRRANPQLRASATTGRTGWIASVRAVGMTVDECRWGMWKAACALNQTRLVVAGVESSRAQFVPGTDPEFDNGRYSALASWNYSL